VVGEFTLDEILTLDLEKLWQSTKSASGIDKQYFDEYFVGRTSGHALKVLKTRRYREPLSLQEDLGITHAPQSFCYLA
jgi:predicted transcriptional regulator